MVESSAKSLAHIPGFQHFDLELHLKAVQVTTELNLFEGMCKKPLIINEVRGLREKAHKLKTPSKRLERLQQAKVIVDRGLAEIPGNITLQSTMDVINKEIEDTLAAME